MADMQIKELFARDIERPIEEVIKVDQDDAQIVHVDLRLSDPSTPRSVELLRGLGFFFGGILPELRDGDVIRLQSTREEPRDRSGIEVFSEVGERLLEFVLDDREALLASSSPASRRCSTRRASTVGSFGRISA